MSETYRQGASLPRWSCYGRGSLRAGGGNRPPHLRAAIDAVAENLPFADGTFDAAMTTFSIHYGRPERLLKPGARQACSAWSFAGPALDPTGST